MSETSFKMLIGIDFSDCSERALARALPLAERLAAAVYLVHVCPIQVASLSEALVAPALEQEDLDRSMNLLDQIRQRLPLPEVHLQVRVGDPVLGLLDAAKEVAPDLMVVGSHGRGAMMRALLGSVSEQLCRRSPVPVMVVPGPHGQASQEADKGSVPAELARPDEMTWACKGCGHIRKGREGSDRCAACGLHPAQWDAAQVTHLPVDSVEPATGEGVYNENQEDRSSPAMSLVGISPPGIQGYSSNAELRVRY
jgi:nucleotide-binding universal stress UspA family protein/rubredoxin